MDLDLDTVDRLLTTTRSVRKRLDLARAVDPAVLERAIEIALQAPTGSNSQGWHFVVVTEARKRARIGELYRKAFEAYVDMPNAFRDALAPEDP
ncbi:MAG: nitroreductase family protein, partial [Deltaproteobacteria bacterium]